MREGWERWEGREGGLAESRKVIETRESPTVET